MISQCCKISMLCWVDRKLLPLRLLSSEWRKLDKLAEDTDSAHTAEWLVDSKSFMPTPHSKVKTLSCFFRLLGILWSNSNNRFPRKSLSHLSASISVNSQPSLRQSAHLKMQENSFFLNPSEDYWDSSLVSALSRRLLLLRKQPLLIRSHPKKRLILKLALFSVMLLLRILNISFSIVSSSALS